MLELMLSALLELTVQLAEQSWKLVLSLAPVSAYAGSNIFHLCTTSRYNRSSLFRLNCRNLRPRGTDITGLRGFGYPVVVSGSD